MKKDNNVYYLDLIGDSECEQDDIWHEVDIDLNPKGLTEDELPRGLEVHECKTKAQRDSVVNFMQDVCTGHDRTHFIILTKKGNRYFAI